MQDTAEPGLAGTVSLAKLEADLHEHLYEQNQDARDMARIKQAMRERAKIINGLSHQINLCGPGTDRTSN